MAFASLSTKRLPRGVTLIEMMIALSLFLVVFGLAVPFFRYQARSVMYSAGRLDALQNARYAQNAIDRDLRIAGIGVVAKQPLIVQADPYAVTFNADLATKDPNDPVSIYYDPDMDSLGTVSMQTTARVQLPRTTRYYPDSNYYNTTLPSPAETISYWVAIDSAAGRSDEYILYRRVNALAPHIVARGIIIPSGKSFFTYMKPDSTGKLDSIRTAKLPIYHTAPIHSSAADTGGSAWTDSIRVVRVTVSGLYHDPQKGDILRTVVSSTKLLNAGMLRSTVCGDVPIAPTSITATAVPANGATNHVHLTWNSSLDQDAGEKDVERYVLYKRLAAASDWGSPIADVAASQPNYTLDDTNISVGTWVYGVVAQDCSPANSTVTVSNGVTVTGS